LQALEIESSFVSTLTSEEEGDEESVFDDWSSVDPNAIVAPVGRMIRYKGTGMELGINGGIKISALQIGLSVGWIAASFYGYSKRYMYLPEYLQAGGLKYWDRGDCNIVRIMGQIKYGIPLWKLQLQFQTRLGTMIIGKTPLIFGRAVVNENAVTGDLGISLAFRANRWFAVNILGYGGFYAFTGKYEGAFGSLGGFNAGLGFYF
jgi:hypothetical protein